MPEPMQSYAARRLYDLLLDSRSRPYAAEDLARPTVVIAPHFDDETLGCGGLITLKRRAGAPVDVIFMTDGGRSHRRHIDSATLAGIRAAEGLAACATLGVDASHVHRLDYPELQLLTHREVAAERLAGLLGELQPEELFIPYRLDPPEDHQATTAIALDAARRCGLQAIVYEYPIWHWDHWPWTPAPRGSVRRRLRAGHRSARALLGSLQHLRCHITIEPVLGLKARALAEHRSQMTRLIPAPDWLTLADVAGGAFLACFFRETERFYRHSC